MAIRMSGDAPNDGTSSAAWGLASNSASCCSLTSRVVAAVAIVFAVAAGIAPAAASEVSQTCQRDAIIVLSQVRQARTDLSDAATGSDKERCAAWRNQAAALRKASAFYKRCQSGQERARNVANANAGAAQYDNAARAQCTDG